MNIQRIIISNLRNHSYSDIPVDGNINVFYGLNGSGKTTILESIAICSYSKSFQQVPDASLIKFNENSYSCEITGLNDIDINYKVRVAYTAGKRKEIASTFGTNILAKDIIGVMPVIALSPDLKVITSGTPQDRRDFLDRLLSQSSRTYFEKLNDYKKVLKQRNNLLSKLKNEQSPDKNLLDSFTEMLIRIGTDLIIYRNNFINDFIPFFDETHRSVSEQRENVALMYNPNNLGIEMFKVSDPKKEIIDHFQKLSERVYFEEIRRGVSVFGPHKDDLLIKIGSGVAKDVASQGQHKTLLISLKFAEFNFLKVKRNETPVILLDDIFSELDFKRSGKVFELLQKQSAQTFVTITEIGNLKKLAINSDFKYYEVNSGSVNKI